MIELDSGGDTAFVVPSLYSPRGTHLLGAYLVFFVRFPCLTDVCCTDENEEGLEPILMMRTPKGGLGMLAKLRAKVH